MAEAIKPDPRPSEVQLVQELAKRFCKLVVLPCPDYRPPQPLGFLESVPHPSQPELGEEDKPRVGLPTNMKTQTRLTSSVTTDSVFEIVLAPKKKSTCALFPGWNLIGTDIISSETIGQALSDTDGKRLSIGPGWYWVDGSFRRARPDEAFAPERGYWFYSPTGGTSSGVTGVQADGVILLRPGWNLLTPVVNCVISGDIGSSAWTWNAEDQIYGEPVSISPDESLTLIGGTACWLLFEGTEARLIHTGDVEAGPSR